VLSGAGGGAQTHRSTTIEGCDAEERFRRVSGIVLFFCVFLQANLIGRFHYLARVCRKMRDSSSLTVLQRVLDMLPVQLKGSEVTGVIYGELARSYLQLALQSTTR